MDVRESLTSGTSQVRHPWETARLWFVVKLIHGLFKPVQTVGTILDVGSGDLFVARSLLGLSPSVNALCMDSAYTPGFEIPGEIFSKDESLRIEIFSRFDQCKNRNPISIILMLDVLEHIEKPVEFLKDMKGSFVLSPGVKLIVTVPAFQLLFSSHDKFLKHYRRYTKKQLCKQLEEAGFVVLESGYIFASLLPFRLLAVLLEKTGLARNVPASTGITAFVKRSPLVTLMHGILCIDATIVHFLNRAGVPVPGLSCFAVCKNTLS
jgi:hypothetical protein